MWAGESAEVDMHCPRVARWLIELRVGICWVLKGVDCMYRLHRAYYVVLRVVRRLVRWCGSGTRTFDPIELIVETHGWQA
jgi:hypothetical protein